MSAWGGVSGLGLGLSLLTSQFGGQAELGKIVSLLASKQARQVGIQDRKGELREGLDADFVIFDPKETRTVSLVRWSSPFVLFVLCSPLSSDRAPD